MQRIAVCIGLVGVLVAGCQGPQPHRELGPPPAPVLSTRPPRVVEPIAPPVEQPAARPATGAGLRGVTIVVDPGHGGRDPGALGRGPVVEKTINLDIAQELAERLKSRGARVVMTRNADKFIELDARAAVADRTKADLFVSIHADSAKRSSATGMTVYISRSASNASRQAGDQIGSALRRAGFQFRGVQGAGYRVLVGHSRPAVLVECGFISNHSEATALADPDYRERVAAAIAEGIADHFGD